MNRMFQVLEDDVIILTNNKGTVTRKVQDNIEEILITENNIEEMKSLIENENKKITKSKNKIKHAKYIFFLSSLWILTFILNIIFQNLFFAGSCFLCGSLLGFIYFNTILPEKKSIKASKKNISILEENLTLETNKLNKLNKDKSKGSVRFNPEIKSINKSEQIIKLQAQLDTIYMYTIYKDEIIKYYKKGILTEKLNKYSWLNHENFYLVEELIKNDINNEMKNATNEINNAKIRTLKKK